jgi:hypothetical protein
MIVAYPKFLNLNIQLINPGNQIISQGESFRVQTVNPYQAGLTWYCSDTSNLNIIESDINHITLQCMTLFTTQYITVNSINPGFSANVPFTVTSIISPSSFNLLNMTSSNMLVQWRGGTTDAGYNVYYTDSLSNISPIYTIQSNIVYKKAVLSNITTLIYYTVTIDRFNTSGTIVNSFTSIPFAYALAPPSLNITNLTSNASLSWSSTASFGAAGYSLVSSNITNSTTTRYNLSLSNILTISVIPTNSYIFTLSSYNAYNAYGDSITTSVTSNDYALAPTDFKFSLMTSNSIAASWTANSNNGSYIISLTNNYGYIFTSNIYSAPSIENPLIFSSNLSFGVSNYNLNIIPYTPTRNIQGFTISQPTGLYANATSNISIVSINGFTNSVTLTWTNALNANSYVIDSIPSTNRLSTLTNSITMSNLIYGSNYLFTVSSLNQYDVLGNSNTTLIPVRIGSGPSNLLITQITQSLMTLSWSTNIDAAYYILNYHDLNGDLISTNLDYTISTITLSNINTISHNVNPDLTGYTASNILYDNNGAHTSLITGLYAYPVTYIYTSLVTIDTIILNWTPGLNNLVYSITIVPSNGEDPYTAFVENPTITIANLSENTQYIITISSQTPVTVIDNNTISYISCSSSTSVVTTASAPPPPPQAVTNFIVTTILPTSVVLSWTDASGASSYSIGADQNPLITPQIFYPSGSGTTIVTFITLTPSTYYTFTITSITGSTTGGYATSAGITTLSPPPQPQNMSYIWDSNQPDYGSSYIFTNNSLTVTALQPIDLNQPTILSTLTISPNNKVIVSVSFDNVEQGSQRNAIGLANANFNTASYLGSDNNSFGIYDNGSINDHNGQYSGHSIADRQGGFSINSTNIIDFAIDTSNNLLWIRNESTDNTWYGDPNYMASADPSAGNSGGGLDINYLGTHLIFAINLSYNTMSLAGQVTIQENMARNLIPSGYTFIPIKSYYMYWDPQLEPITNMEITNNLQSVANISRNSTPSTQPIMYTLDGISTTGKYYWGIKINSLNELSENHAIGFGNAQAKTILTLKLGQDANSIGYYDNGLIHICGNSIQLNNGFAVEDIITLALDTINSLLWFYNSRTQVWTNINQGQGSGNPSNPNRNGGGIDVSSLRIDSIYPAVMLLYDSINSSGSGQMSIATIAQIHIPPGNDWVLFNPNPSIPSPTYYNTSTQQFTAADTATGWSLNTPLQTHVKSNNPHGLNYRHDRLSYIIGGDTIDFPDNQDKDTFKGYIVDYLYNNDITITISTIKIYKTNNVVQFRIHGRQYTKSTKITIGTLLVNLNFINYINQKYNISNFTISFPLARTERRFHKSSRQNICVYDTIRFTNNVQIYTEQVTSNGRDFISKPRGVLIQVAGLYVITIISYKSYHMNTYNKYFASNSPHLAIQVINSNTTPILVQYYSPPIGQQNKNKVTVYLNEGDVIAVNNTLHSKHKSMSHLVFSASLVISYKI